jgi:hypothetical protein
VPATPGCGCCKARPTWVSSKSSFLTGAPPASERGLRGLVGSFFRGAPGGGAAAGIVWFGGVTGSGCEKRGGRREGDSGRRKPQGATASGIQACGPHLALQTVLNWSLLSGGLAPRLRDAKRGAAEQ